MAKRRIKPAGLEKWTWREIDAGYKMSKGQRRAAHRWDVLGGVRPGGPPQAPGEMTGAQIFYAVAIVIAVVIAIASSAGHK